MTTQRKKLMKLLGSAQLRDFSSVQEMEQAKALHELMAQSEQPQPRKRKKVLKPELTDTEKAAQKM